MRKLVSVLFAIALLDASGLTARAQEAQPSPASSPTAAPTAIAIPSPVPAAEDPRIHKLALTQFVAWQQGSIDRSLYSQTLNAQLTDTALATASATLANMGALQSIAFRGIARMAEGSLYVYRVTCANGAVDMDFSLDRSGKIAIIFFN